MSDCKSRESRVESRGPDGPVRLIIDEQPNSGAWNMALDEALLESAVQRGLCTVRIYRWSQPTVSLGYFQRIEDIDPASPWAALPRVRRLSGGGAILHHHEWTYSCALPAGHPAIRAPHALYETAHRRIIDVLREYGVDAALRGDVATTHHSPLTTHHPPFLCFSRGDACDIVLRGHKIVGSAQRRRKGAVLQHGSILLQSSRWAPHLPGIAELVGEFKPTDVTADQLGRSIAMALSGKINRAEPTDVEMSAAERIQTAAATGR